MTSTINTEALVARKGYVFEELTRLHKKVKSKEFCEAIEAETCLITLNRLEASYFDLVNEILTVNTLVESSKSITTKDFEAFQTLIERIRVCCLKCKANEKSDTGTAQGAASVKLPKLLLPTFSGDIGQWHMFIEQYNTTVHSRNMSNIEKLVYLRSVLTKEPLAIVSQYELNNDSYGLAYEALKKRYDNKRILANYHLNKILNFKFHNDGRQFTEFLEVHRAASASIQNMNIHDLADYLLFELSYRNLPVAQQKYFDREFGPATIPTLKDLFTHIDKLAKSEELHSEIAPDLKGKHRKILLGVANEKPTCPNCKENHQLFRCRKFADLPTDDKFKIVEKYGACKSCLGIHKGACQSKYSCRKCNSTSHHTFLCGKGDPTQNSYDRNSPPYQSVTHKSCNTCLSTSTQILLGTIQTHVKDAWGNFHKVRIVCDTGSQVNLITHALMQRLGLRKFSVPFDVQGLSQSNAKILGSVSLTLKTPNEEDPNYTLDAIVLKNICSSLPGHPVSKLLPETLKEVKLADPEFYATKPIDILLGADACTDIMCTQEPTILKGDPTAIRTIFGYILIGRTHPITNPPRLSLCTTSLEKTLRQFWEAESADTEKLENPEDVTCEEHFRKTHKRDDKGRYIVSLPFRPGATPLGSNLNSAMRSFQKLEQRFKRVPGLAESYSSVLKDYEDQNHMTIALDKRQYVLPHHCVFKDSSTTAVRVVFDASSPDDSGQSLNSRLLSGPKLQNELPELLISFRFHEVALQADIKQMFRNISLAPDDRKHQRILWRKSPDQDIQQYDLNTVTFGLTCSPYIAQRVLKQLVEDEGKPYPEASHAILHHTFVDDFVTGAASIEAAKSLRQDLSELLAKGGFELRKWASSHQEALEQLPEEHKEVPFVFPTGEHGVKVLGLLWEQASDCFRYHVIEFNAPVVTKRAILSYIARLWDCLGLVSAVTIKAKVFLQRLWLQSVGWDEPLAPELCSSWLQLASEIPILRELKIPRKISTRNNDIQLIGFSDASETAMAATVYIRSISPEGTVSSHLILSKTKLAPLKTWTIPRLELSAAVLLTKSVLTVLKTGLTVKEIILFTDSQIVLAWLKIPPHNLKIFVANRVIQIKENIPNAHWRFVSGTQNPADISSRGLLPSQLLHNQLWWKGPEFLQLPCNAWPSSEGNILPEECPELKPANQVLTVTIEDSEFRVTNLVEKISSLSKLKRIVAYILRFINNCKSKGVKNKGFLTTEELKSALLICIRLTQEKYFESELKSLIKNKGTSKSLRKLTPYLDKTQLLRAGGRLRRAESIPEDAKHPFLLPKKCNLSRIICDYYHQKLLHAGPSTTQAAILQQFWILSIRQLIRKRIRLCLRCFRFSAAPTQPVMGELPYGRVNVSRPFSNVSIDFGGPITTKESRVRSSVKHKSYFCVFVCMSTKAIHIETVTDLSAKAFIAALYRFASRRGLPLNIYSDCGRNFVGAARALNDAKRISELELAAREFSTDQGFTWHFSPPYSPNFNGLAEAAIKSAKRHLSRQIGEDILTLEELSTLLCRTEAALNSRPLIAPSTDPSEISYLSPAHFLIGDQIISPPEAPVEDLTTTRRWELIQKKSRLFWKQWSREYLNTLLQRQRWTKSSENLKVGQIVLIIGEKVSPLQWPVGRVTVVHTGEDGIGRVATIQTASGRELRRPISKLIVLPYED